MIDLESEQRQLAVDPEKTTEESIGVVVVVINAKSLDGDSPMVSTLIELQGKPETEKIAGQISFPAETKKGGEKELDTVTGALAEFTDSDHVLERLKVLPGKFISRKAISVRGKPLDVAFLVFDGPIDEALQPIDGSETRSNGWLPINDIQFMNGEAREITHDAIHFMNTWDLIGHFKQNRAGMVPLTDLLEPGFSLREFIQRRDAKADVPLS